jgi:hypothetical protein
MAKKRKVGRPKEPVLRESVVSLKGVPAWKKWLDEFSAHCGLSIADTIGQALQHYAEHRGYGQPPRR